MNTEAPKPKLQGAGDIVYHCADCGKVIDGQPLLIHRDGRLVALHHTHEDMKDGR